MLIEALFLLAAAHVPEDCDNAISQSEMTACAQADFARADAALNAQWKVTMAAMKRRDREDQLGYADALLAAQRAWLAYRDAQCVIEGYEMRDGSAQPMLVAGCKATLTRQRTKQLKDLVWDQ